MHRIMNEQPQTQREVVVSRDEEEKIQVRRVRQRPSSNPSIHSPELESAAEAMERNDIGNPTTEENNEEIDEWEGINEEEDGEIYETSELSDSASVLTLYFSQQETIISNGDEIEHTPPEVSTELLEKFRFTHAKSKADRSRSAPARPLTELEEFKESAEFQALEQAALDASELLYKNGEKLDLDSAEGHYACKKFLERAEALSKSLKVKPSSREYRQSFSQAYKVLYKEGALCYLTEILDSAQEGFPYIIVNSEKYIFSPNVLQTGERLFSSFIRLKEHLRDTYSMFCEENIYSNNIQKALHGLQKSLHDFDIYWAKFEKIYVFELMLIEKDARRFIIKAIEAEKELKSYETSEKLKGRVVIKSARYDLLRKKFIEICGQINALSNFIGKGRDDLGLEVLLAAEDVSRRVSDYKSKAVRKLAVHIKAAFMSLRTVFRKYSENLDAVDPQLKNNQDLVDALVEFEKSWEKGKTYLLNPGVLQMLINFSQFIEGLAEKYHEIKEKLEFMDADIFLLIPCLEILRTLEENDRTIYNLYYPEFGSSTSDKEAFTDLKRIYQEIKDKGDGYLIYNQLEQTLLEKDNDADKSSPDDVGARKEEIDKLIHEVKRVAILLQRNKPMEWNSLIETAMGTI